MFQLHWDIVWTYNHLHLKELEILRKLMYYLKYDKFVLKPTSASHSQITVSNVLVIQTNLLRSLELNRMFLSWLICEIIWVNQHFGGTDCLIQHIRTLMDMHVVSEMLIHFNQVQQDFLEFCKLFPPPPVICISSSVTNCWFYFKRFSIIHDFITCYVWKVIWCHNCIQHLCIHCS